MGWLEEGRTYPELLNRNTFPNLWLKYQRTDGMKLNHGDCERSFGLLCALMKKDVETLPFSSLKDYEPDEHISFIIDYLQDTLYPILPKAHRDPIGHTNFATEDLFHAWTQLSHIDWSETSAKKHHEHLDKIFRVDNYGNVVSLYAKRTAPTAIAFDHYFPFSRGGRTRTGVGAIDRNIIVVQWRANLAKSDAIEQCLLPHQLQTGLTVEQVANGLSSTNGFYGVPAIQFFLGFSPLLFPDELPNRSAVFVRWSTGLEEDECVRENILTSLKIIAEEENKTADSYVRRKTKIAKEKNSSRIQVDPYSFSSIKNRIDEIDEDDENLAEEQKKKEQKLLQRTYSSNIGAIETDKLKERSFRSLKRQCKDYGIEWEVSEEKSKKEAADMLRERLQLYFTAKDKETQTSIKHIEIQENEIERMTMEELRSFAMANKIALAGTSAFRKNPLRIYLVETMALLEEIKISKKQELRATCDILKISSEGKKSALRDRIEHKIRTGEALEPFIDSSRSKEDSNELQKEKWQKMGKKSLMEECDLYKIPYHIPGCKTKNSMLKRLFFLIDAPLKKHAELKLQCVALQLSSTGSKKELLDKLLYHNSALPDHKPSLKELKQRANKLTPPELFQDTTTYAKLSNQLYERFLSQSKVELHKIGNDFNLNIFGSKITMATRLSGYKEPKDKPVVFKDKTILDKREEMCALSYEQWMELPDNELEIWCNENGIVKGKTKRISVARLVCHPTPVDNMKVAELRKTLQFLQISDKGKKPKLQQALKDACA